MRTPGQNRPGPPESSLLVKGFGNLKQERSAANWIDLLSNYFLMGQTQFRRGEIAEMATGQMPDLIGIKHLDANASTFEFVEFNVDINEGFALAA